MILCAGESLIDFIPTRAGDGGSLYRPTRGGSVHNVALSLARLDVPVAFVGGISTDFFGDTLAAGLGSEGVLLQHVVRLDRPTTLAFVTLQDGEARYAFYDAEAADRHWRLEDMGLLSDDVTAIQFGCISLLREPAATDYERLMRREVDRLIIGFDANIRPDLVRNEAPYRRRLETFFEMSHIIKVSDADLEWIAPGADPHELARGWLQGNARLVLLTRGGAGAEIVSRKGAVSRPARAIDVADTVGAGDSFTAATLAALCDRDWMTPTALDALSTEDLSPLLDFALAVAALTCSRIGADPPSRSELAGFLEKGG